MKKIPHKTKRRRARHRAAVETPGTRSKIGRVKRNWDTMSKVQRGKHVRDLINRGCSLRGLSDGLGRSVASIRRYRDIGHLTVEQQELIEAGASAKAILNLEYSKARERRRLQHSKDQEKRWRKYMADESIAVDPGALAAHIMLLAVKDDAYLMAYDEERLFIELRLRMNDRIPPAIISAWFMQPTDIILGCTPPSSNSVGIEDRLQLLKNLAVNLTPTWAAADQAIALLEKRLRAHKESLPKATLLELYRRYRMGQVQKLEIPRRPQFRKSADLLRGTPPFFSC
jgi:hypothetical protein